MVGAVQGVAAVGELFHGRRRVPRVRLGTDVRGLARLHQGESLRRRRCSSASPRPARPSTSSTRRPVMPHSAVRLSPAGSASSPASSSGRRRGRAARRARAAGGQPCRRPAAHHRSRREPRPTELVVALGLGDPVLQAGVVRDGEVILARGLEVDIARALARRLGIPRVSFVFVARPLDCSRPRSAPGISRSRRSVRRRRIVARRSQRPVSRHRPGRRAPSRPSPPLDARRPPRQDHVRPCVGATGRGRSPAPSLRSCVPSSPHRTTRLLELVQTGACDAALVDADGVGRFVAGRGGLLGPVRARVEAGGGYVVAVTRGGPIAVAEVDRALARMRADGTMHRLMRTVARHRPCASAAAALTPPLLGGARRSRPAGRSTGT